MGSSSLPMPCSRVIVVVVSSTAIPEPVAVRYGWANVMSCNLANGEGLPASPFRAGVKSNN